MNRILTSAILIATVALGACTNPDRFGDQEAGAGTIATGIVSSVGTSSSSSSTFSNACSRACVATSSSTFSNACSSRST